VRHRLGLELDQIDRTRVPRRLVHPIRPAHQRLEGQGSEHIIARQRQPRGRHAKDLPPGGEEFVDDLIGFHVLMVAALAAVGPASV
jgi:hypothetical protein